MDFSELQQQMQTMVGDTGSATQADIKIALNLAYREMCGVSPNYWERNAKDLTVPTDGYTAGTIAATKASADVTGTDTTWTTEMTGRTICIDGDSVEYVFTFASETTGTLDRVYEGENVAVGDYIIFEPTADYDLDVACRKVLRIRPPIAVAGIIRIVDNDAWNELITDWDAAGTPVMARVTDRGTANEMKIELHPIPKGADAGTYKYDGEFLPADMSADDDVPIFGAQWDACLLDMARCWLFKIKGESEQKIAGAQQAYQERLARFVALGQVGADLKGA